MAYIKISDPNIIDLAAWHQVINVVNQHSDSITSITNNFGAQGTGTTQWNSDNNISHQFDPGSQKIVFGREKIVVADTGHSSGETTLLYGDVSFVDTNSGSTVFTSRPIITATIQFGYGSLGSSTPSTDSSVVVTIHNLDADGFSYRIKDANSKPTATVALTGTFYLNWMAIGPKG
jgi:hypothetical protein